MAVASCTVAATVNVHQRLHVWAAQHEPYDPFRLLPVAVGVGVVTLAYLIVTRRGFDGRWRSGENAKMR